MVTERARRGPGDRGERALAVTLDALRVGAVERQPGEELGRHAPAAARVVGRTRLAGAPGLRPAQVSEELRFSPDRRSRVSRSCAPNRSAMALKSFSWLTFWLVTTTEILKPRKPASARWRIARSAVAYEPGPRTASLTSAVAPSREICT